MIFESTQTLKMIKKYVSVWNYIKDYVPVQSIRDSAFIGYQPMFQTINQDFWDHFVYNLYISVLQILMPQDRSMIAAEKYIIHLVRVLKPESL